MDELGWLLYVVGAAILLYMWWQGKTFNHDKMMTAQNKHHVRVHKVLAKHPKSGDWAHYKKWMRGKV